MVPHNLTASRPARVSLCILLAAALVLTASIAQAVPITVPTGLNVGDQYYLAFVTSGLRDATSSDIADYDAFVNAEADDSISPEVAAITWRALGSTLSVEAIDHLGLGEFPIYLLDGSNQVATGGIDLWNGDNLTAPVLIDENGDLSTSLRAWTGTLVDGTASPLNSLGSANPIEGDVASLFTPDWVNFGNATSSNIKSVYAFSELQTVPVPEPASLAVWAVLGGSAVAFGLKRRQRTTAG